MNKDNAKDYLPLVQALAEGKVIQLLCGSTWEDTNHPAFNLLPENYRIKPEPEQLWAVYFEETMACAFSSEESAKRFKTGHHLSHRLSIKKFIEVQ